MGYGATRLIVHAFRVTHGGTGSMRRLSLAIHVEEERVVENPRRLVEPCLVEHADLRAVGHEGRLLGWRRLGVNVFGADRLDDALEDAALALLQRRSVSITIATRRPTFGCRPDTSARSHRPLDRKPSHGDSSPQ